MNLVLLRYPKASDRVLGILLQVDYRTGYACAFCSTLEPLNCIPAGTYQVRVSWSPRFQCLLPEIINVPGRTGIRIHAGNYPKDTTGCILVGELCSDYITQSKFTLNELMKEFQLYAYETHTIRIIDAQ